MDIWRIVLIISLRYSSNVIPTVKPCKYNGYIATFYLIVKISKNILEGLSPLPLYLCMYSDTPVCCTEAPPLGGGAVGGGGGVLYRRAPDQPGQSGWLCPHARLLKRVSHTVCVCAANNPVRRPTAGNEACR